MNKRLSQLIKAVGDGTEGELEVENFVPTNIYNDSKEKIGEDRNRANPDKTTVYRNDLLRWAKKVTIDLPLFLSITESKTFRLDNIVEQILDEDHDFYPERLAAAILAWEATYIKKIKFIDKNSHIDQIVEHLKKIYRKELGCEPPSHTMLKKIATVATRFPKKK